MKGRFSDRLHRVLPMPGEGRVVERSLSRREQLHFNNFILENGLKGVRDNLTSRPIRLMVKEMSVLGASQAASRDVFWKDRWDRDAL